MSVGGIRRGGGFRPFFTLRKAGGWGMIETGEGELYEPERTIICNNTGAM